ncbi:DUF3800 domain-containing protein (plasmid) [Methylomonas sp. EFPC1]|uniref:DUF3800 domain-containing protein n=1 Tax=Methylomonas sp. EFPC1 TaxID=2812647 RepID=UPI0019677C1D|nr:DUF3800 domain-containing protein [Methylomonas sp. EFPC1]QSB03800.1 DUF3800 domain-containing protein [Methylomonas sp. EFPC1]
MNFYIDESGNTGDLSLSGPDMDFGTQPVFTLACVGLSDENDLSTALNELKKKHKVQASEVKLSKLLKRKPKFILETVDFLLSSGSPFFIEVVDKKYHLAVNITNNFVWPPYFNTEENQGTIFLKNIFSDFIYHKIGNKVFYEFLQSMKEPSNEKINRMFALLQEAIADIDHDVAKALRDSVNESKDDFRIMQEQEGELAYKRFLPVPDKSKRGQTIWMLPNYSCFTNIYARINLYLSGNISSCKIFHDEQLQFDQIISEAKSQLESNPITSYIPSFADYRFKQSAELFFKVSHDSAGIQIADILAGLSMRWCQSYLNGEVPTGPIDEAIDRLLHHSSPPRGIGINLVATQNAAFNLFGEPGY